MFVNDDWYYGEGGDLLMTKGGVCSPMEILPWQEAQMDLDWQMQML